MNRRDFLKKTAIVGAGGLLLSNRAFEARISAKRPNILFIMSDEHNAGVLGSYGNGIIRSPSLDLLAKRGVTFENCYTNSPLCVPCRLSFTAGKYICLEQRLLAAERRLSIASSHSQRRWLRVLPMRQDALRPHPPLRFH